MRAAPLTAVKRANAEMRTRLKRLEDAAMQLDLELAALEGGKRSRRRVAAKKATRKAAKAPRQAAPKQPKKAAKIQRKAPKRKAVKRARQRRRT